MSGQTSDEEDGVSSPPPEPSPQQQTTQQQISQLNTQHSLQNSNAPYHPTMSLFQQRIEHQQGNIGGYNPYNAIAQTAAMYGSMLSQPNLHPFLGFNPMNQVPPYNPMMSNVPNTPHISNPPRNPNPQPKMLTDGKKNYRNRKPHNKQPKKQQSSNNSDSDENEEDSKQGLNFKKVRSKVRKELMKIERTTGPTNLREYYTKDFTHYVMQENHAKKMPEFRDIARFVVHKISYSTPEDPYIPKISNKLLQCIRLFHYDEEFVDIEKEENAKTQKLMQEELNKSMDEIKELNKVVYELKGKFNEKEKSEHVVSSVIVKNESGTIVSESTHDTESKSSTGNKNEAKVTFDQKTKRERRDHAIDQRWKHANYRRREQENLRKQGRYGTYNDGSDDHHGKQFNQGKNDQDSKWRDNNRDRRDNNRDWRDNNRDWRDNNRDWRDNRDRDRDRDRDRYSDKNRDRDFSRDRDRDRDHDRDRNWGSDQKKGWSSGSGSGWNKTNNDNEKKMELGK